jgi:dTDP-4-dehydrorhamnose reductase
LDKPQIIGIGLNGLVGSRITEILSDKFEFIPVSTSTGVDITKPETLVSIKDYSKANFILHLAAKTDVDGCEAEKDLGDQSEAWKINVNGSGHVAEIARETGKKVIYISTDFVFDGEKPISEEYTEKDQPNPVNFYAETKFEGERKIEESGADFAILRIAYPYRAQFDTKPDFMRAIKGRLEKGLEIKGVTDHIFCPTFIDDLASVIEMLIKNDATGIYHSVGSERLSPYEASIKIAEVFGLDKNLISETTREEFFRDRAMRPFNLALSNAKINELGVNMRGFEECLQLVKSELQ